MIIAPAMNIKCGLLTENRTLNYSPLYFLTFLVVGDRTPRWIFPTTYHFSIPK